MADVTILTVNFNTRRFIELCVKSVLQNTTVPFRLIVVDNGSTDGSKEYLLPLAKSGKIHLVVRKSKMAASEHGRALDQILYSAGLVKTKLVCTIDSDAYVAKKGWIAELNRQRGNYFAVGYEHFRDPHYLHPACMLFNYGTLLRIGKPTFALTKKDNQFYDTGIIVSQTALRNGEKLVGGRGLEAMVPHRWCATRVLKVSGDERLDGQFTRSEFDTESNKWFARPEVVRIMSSKI